MTKSIVIDNKYTFVITDEYQVKILRYGEPWREFEVGDNAVYALVARAIELEEGSRLPLEKYKGLSTPLAGFAHCVPWSSI